MSERLPCVLGARALVGVLLRAQGNLLGYQRGEAAALERLVEDVVDGLLLRSSVSGEPLSWDAVVLPATMGRFPAEEVCAALCEELRELRHDCHAWAEERDHAPWHVGPAHGTLPLLPICDWVSFPNVPTIYRVGPATHTRLTLQRDLPREERLVLVVSQRDPDAKPSPEGLHAVGTVAYVWETAQLSNGSRKVLVQPLYRAWLADVQWQGDALVGRFRALPEPEDDEGEVAAGLLLRHAAAAAQRLAQQWGIDPLRGVTSIGEAADLLAAFLTCPVVSRQPLLEEMAPRRRLQAVLRAVYARAAA